MTKKSSLVLTVLFCLFLGGVFITNIFTPSKAFSEQENRYLAQRPEFSIDALVSGRFTADYEDYVSDQFFWRDGWISVKSRSEYVSGKRENNGIYICGDLLIARVDEPSAGLLERNREAVKTLSRKLSVPLYFTVIPGADTILADELPRNAPNYGADELIAGFDNDLLSVYFDTLSVLNAHKDEDIFYRTDHHWTSLGAYYGYCALMEAMELEAVALGDYEKTAVSEEFYGTAYSFSGVRWLSPDSIDIYVPADGVSVTSYSDGSPAEAALYDYTKLSGKDKYSFFLGGNQPLCIVRSDREDLPKLLIVRDSFADSMVPFLTAHFSEIHLIDLRYYKASVPDYVSENGIDAVLVSYGASGFASDTNIGLLGR